MRRTVFLCLLFLLPTFTFAQSDASTRLRLPWNEIKRLLGLEKDLVQLDWEEFKKLSERTTPSTAPPYRSVNGKVVLTRTEFTNLINNLRPPPPIPSESMVTSGFYRARLVNDSVLVRAVFQLHLQNRENRALKIDLFPAQVAFSEIQLDGQPAFTEIEKGRLFLTTTKSGPVRVEIAFAVQDRSIKSNQRLTFPLRETPITDVELLIPDTYIDVTVEGALAKESRVSAQGTVVRVLLSPSRQITAKWNPTRPESDKGPAQVYATVDSFLSAEDDALRVQSLVQLQVLKNTIDAVRLKIPEEFDVLDVQGDSLGEWSQQGDSPKILTVPFRYARKDALQFRVVMEQIWSEKKVTIEFNGLQVVGAATEKGTVGIGLPLNAEVQAEALEGLEKTDIQELPPSLQNLTARPFLFAFRFQRSPMRLKLAVTLHPDVALLSSSVDEAAVTTWVHKDGHLIHRLNFHVQNSWNTYMELNLLEDVSLWSAFVEGRPIKPTRNEKGHLLVPLSRSQRNKAGPQTFLVELTLHQRRPRIGGMGVIPLQFPLPNMVVSHLRWTQVIPNGLKFFSFVPGLAIEKPVFPRSVGIGGSIEPRISPRDELRLGGVSTPDSDRPIFKEMEASELPGPDAGKSMRERDKLHAAKPRDYKDAEPAARRPIEGVLTADKDSRAPGFKRMNLVAGVLPIQVHMPFTGQSITFTRSLITDQSSVRAHVWFVSTELLKGALFLLIVGILSWAVAFRSKMGGWGSLLVQKGRLLWPAWERHKGNPHRSVLLFAVLVVLASFLSKLLTYLFLLGFMGSLAWWLVSAARMNVGGKK